MYKSLLRRPKFLQHISSKWIIWGGMTGCGLYWDTFFTPRTDFESRLLHQQHIRESGEACPSPQKCEWNNRQKKLFSSNRHMTFVQDGAPAHAAKATQAWCKKNLPNFIEKTCWPPNSPDINPVENLWSIMDEVVYKDPTPKTMQDLNKPGRKSRSPRYMTYPTPCRNGLGTMITNKGGHAGYWLSEYMYSVKQ